MFLASLHPLHTSPGASPARGDDVFSVEIQFLCTELGKDVGGEIWAPDNIMDKYTDMGPPCPDLPLTETGILFVLAMIKSYL